MTTNEDRIQQLGYQEIPVRQAAKRCGIQWTPWLRDWFTSWSPHDTSSHAEGTWDHWVELAVKILQDPLTARVRPDAHAAAASLPTFNFYSEMGIRLTYDDLAERFATALDDDEELETTTAALVDPTGDPR